MGKYIKTSKEFIAIKSETPHSGTYESIKQRLRCLSSHFKKFRTEFISRHEYLVSRFNLSDKDSKGVIYKLRLPEDKSLQKYIVALDDDPRLIFLEKKMDTIMKNGNMIIMQLLKEEGIDLPGYDLEEFFNDPEKHIEDCFDLILSLYGYQKVHIIDDMVLYEVPAREYITEFTEVLKFVDLWVDGLGVFVET